MGLGWRGSDCGEVSILRIRCKLRLIVLTAVEDAGNGDLARVGIDRIGDASRSRSRNIRLKQLQLVVRLGREDDVVDHQALVEVFLRVAA